jgi:site-specific recombinase XerD
MPRVGRPRRHRLDLPPGCVLRGRVVYWRPGSAAARAERKARGLPELQRVGTLDDMSAMRREWAKAAGVRPDPLAHPARNTIGHLVLRYREDVLEKKRADGTHVLADKTRREYKRQLDVLEARWGERRFARTEAEALGFEALNTLELQSWIDDAEAPVEANRQLSLLSTLFGWARRWKLSVHNPAQGVLKREERPRDREVLPWEIEALLAVAKARMALMIRLERITGWREADVYQALRAKFRADVIRHVQGKRGRRQRWEWSPELRAIVAEAATLPGAEKSLFLFPTEEGTPLTQWGFQSDWRRTREAAREAIREAEHIDVTSAEPWPEALRLPALEDLHFHDLRAAAGDDAEDQGQDAAAFLGNDPSVRAKHYARRGAKVRPIR